MQTATPLKRVPVMTDRQIAKRVKAVLEHSRNSAIETTENIIKAGLKAMKKGVA